MILDLLASIVWKLWARADRKRVAAEGVVDADELQPIHGDDQ